MSSFPKPNYFRQVFERTRTDVQLRDPVKLKDFVVDGKVELSLKILLRDLEILQCHVRALVTEEFDDCRKADARAQHLSSVGVSKLVRDNADGNSDR